MGFADRLIHFFMNCCCKSFTYIGTFTYNIHYHPLITVLIAIAICLMLTSKLSDWLGMNCMAYTLIIIASPSPEPPSPSLLIAIGLLTEILLHGSIKEATN